MSQLTIFVSGTIDDMLAERNAVGDAIESLRLDAVRAETQYSSERSSREECLRMARECDVYLGVYNPARYGWTIPGDNISVTEMEFDASRNKPTLIFVKKCPRDQWDAKQQAFLNRVLDFDGGKFRAVEFESPAQLEDQVAGSLMQLLIERFKLSVTRPPFLAPRHNPNNFVGRQAQIDDLTRALRERATTLVHGLFGVGGLGKTELALHIAHTMRGEFDGGVLWADLPTCLPMNTMADWAREYGADVSKIENGDERARAVREVLRGRRVLAVLDGAVDESDDEKIAPLLRALADCAVIVTSRVTQLASLHDAQPIDLNRMSEDEAWALFGKHVDAARLNDKRDVITTIGAVVDFLPLALDLAAAQLREHKTWTPDDVLARIRDESTRLDTLKYGDGKMRGVRASFEVTYQRLTQDEQKFFAGLGAFGGIDFDVHAAAYVMETTDDAAREWLERFERLSLMQEGRRAFRYKLHPLMRDFARSETSRGEPPFALTSDLRMARYYCDMVQVNGPKLEGAEVESALAILDLELGNIYTGQAWASTVDSKTVGQLDRERRELCRDYIYGAMTYYFNLRAMWNDWIAWSEAGIAACQKLRDERGQGRIASNLGIVYRMRSEWDKAIEYFQDSVAMAEKVGDTQALSYVYGNLGNVYANKGEWDKAIELFQQALGTMEKIGDAHGMAQIFGNLGVIYKNKGEWDKAIEFYQKDLAIIEKVGDVYGMALTYNNLGLVYMDKGEWDKAIEFYQKSLVLCEKVDDVHGMAQTYGNLGIVYHKQGKIDDAIAYCKKSLEIAERLGAVVTSSNQHWNLGTLYEEQGKIAQAIEWIEKAVAIRKKIGDPDAMMNEQHIAELRKKLGEGQRTSADEPAAE